MSTPGKTPPRRSFIGPRDLRLYDALARRPFVLARFGWLRLRRMYRSLKGPAALLTWTNPLWIVPIAVYSQYQQMYALELGLSEAEVGYLGAVLVAGNVVCFLLGGWLTDRLGYKLAIGLFDAIAWPLPMVILAVATEPWHLFAATILMSAATACVPAWHSMFVSKVPPARRAAAYGMMFITLTAPGMIFPLLGGWLVRRYDLVPAMRGAFAVSALLMTAGIVVRCFLLPHIPPSQKRTSGLRKALVDQFRPYFKAVGNRQMWAFMLALVLFNMDVLIGMNFVPIYVMKHLGVPKADYSVVPAVASCVRLAAILLLAPFITPRNTKRAFVFAAGSILTGTLIVLALLRSPQAAVPVLPTVIVAAVFWALGAAVAGPAITSQWTNTIPEKVRNRLWGAHGATRQLAASCAMVGVGHLYEFWSPSLLFVLAGLEVAVLVCFALSPVGTDRSPRAPTD